MLSVSDQVERGDSNELGVMGDELSRKVDSVTFTQERLKRQIDNLDDKVKVRPIGILTEFELGQQFCS